MRGGREGEGRTEGKHGRLKGESHERAGMITTVAAEECYPLTLVEQRVNGGLPKVGARQLVAVMLEPRHWVVEVGINAESIASSEIFVGDFPNVDGKIFTLQEVSTNHQRIDHAARFPFVIKRTRK